MCDCFLVSFQKGYARSPESAYHPAVFHASPAILLSLRLLGILKWDDPTPLGMFFACVFMCIAVVKYKMIDPVKSAKNLIIQNLNEAVVVTDLEGRFLFLNPMAETLVSSMKKKAIHRQKDIEIYDILRGSEGYFDWLDHHYQVEETELQSCNTPQGYMLTLVDVTKSGTEPPHERTRHTGRSCHAGKIRICIQYIP